MIDSRYIQLTKLTDFKSVSIDLPASKSISNRALIISALSRGDNDIQNLSTARDTQTMDRLLRSSEDSLDVIDAGTTMRFLTAYLSVTNQNKILTGSARMKERPIKILVNALRSLGAQIKYLNQDGYPPLRIVGMEAFDKANIEIKGDVSSQYISAIMMIAPLLPNGLTIKLVGKIGSRPYIEMTQEVMKSYGINSDFIENTISIPKGEYTPTPYSIEPDWSAASYWYSFVALSNNSDIFIKGLQPKSIQGDSEIANIMARLGVKTIFEDNGAHLIKVPAKKTFNYDFTDCPDLAQTIAVICAANKIKAEFTGLESLKIKETDRVLALHVELKKIGAELIESDATWTLVPGTAAIEKNITIETYEDHRMAMAFAPLCLKYDITIQEPSVVKKSYPTFWEDLSFIGVSISKAS